MSRRHLLAGLIGIAVATAPGSAQEPISSVIDTAIESSLLAQTRPLRVIVPPSCVEGGCPMVVVLDAEFILPVVAGIHALLSHRFVGTVAPAILVGVPNLDRLRDVTPSATTQFPNGGGADLFLDFLAEEVTPFVKDRWATSGKPVMIGHSGSGLVVLAALDRMPDRWSGLGALDPSADWDDRVPLRRVEESDPLRALSDSVVFTLDSYRVKPEQDELVELLRAGSPWVVWSRAIHAGESHQTLLIPALRRILPLLLPVSERDA